MAPDPVPAARFRRLVAFLIDVALVAFVLALLAAARRWAGLLLADLPEHHPVFSITSLFSALEGVQVPMPERAIAIGVFGLYSLLSWAITGTSFGKWIMGVQLARLDGSRPGVLRCIVRLIALTVLAPFAFTWWIMMFRSDHAALHDLIAGTRVIRMPESGLRRLTRGTMRRALSDIRWAAAVSALIVLLGAGVFAGVRFISAMPAGEDAVIFLPVDEVTQEAVKGAILEYNRLEEYATFRREASLLEPRSTQAWLARKRDEFAELRRAGLHMESRMLDADFKAFRWVGDSRIEVDIVEVWVSVVGDVTGRVLQERPRHQVPQTATVVKERGRWKLADVKHYDPPESAPF